MMLEWMGYTVAVSLLLSLGALAADYAARARRAPGRWIWAAAMLASLALPAAMSQVTIALPTVLAHEGAPTGLPLRAMTSPTLTPQHWAPAVTRPDAPGQAAFDVDTLIQRSWAAFSAVMLLVLGACAIYLYQRKRRWPLRPMAGVAVHVSGAVGPAVVGLLRPRIVVPAWLLEAPAHQQTMVIAHEQSHLDAHDPQLLTLCLLLLVAMPWNLPLWWQLRRLRLAIEIDCDARVLGQGHDRQHYGMTLIDIGQRQSAFVGTAAAMAESPSLLAQRIAIIARKPGPWARRAAPLCAVLAVSMAAVAAQVGPPGAQPTVTLAPEVLAAYAGYYQLDELHTIIVSQTGDKLFAGAYGRVLELVPVSATRFNVKGTQVQYRFSPAAPGQRTTGLVMQQEGVDFPAPRVESDVLERVDAAITERVASQRPMPHSQEVLRRNLDLAQSGGQLQMDDFTPEFGRLVQRMLEKDRKKPNQLGKVKELTFTGVGQGGADRYRVVFEHGTVDWFVFTNAQGKVYSAGSFKSK